MMINGKKYRIKIYEENSRKPKSKIHHQKKRDKFLSFQKRRFLKYGNRNQKPIEWISESERIQIHNVSKTLFREIPWKCKKTKKIQKQRQTFHLLIQEKKQARKRQKHTKILFPFWNFRKIYQILLVPFLEECQEEEEEEEERELDVCYWPGREDFSRYRRTYTVPWTSWFGHTIPTPTAVDLICSTLPLPCACVSIGSGVSLWERILSQETNGLMKIHCVDPVGVGRCAWYPVEQKSANKIDWKSSEFQFQVVFIFWPLPAINKFFNLENFRGNWVVFIGLQNKNYREEEGEEEEEEKESDEKKTHSRRLTNFLPVKNLGPQYGGGFLKWSVGSSELIRQLKCTENWSCVESYSLPSRPCINYFPTLFVFRRNRNTGVCLE